MKQKKNDTDTHVRLKKQATLWLRQCHKVTNVEYETQSSGGFCDIMSNDGNWVVECGATRPSKVWQQYDCDSNDKSSLVVFNDVGIAVFRVGTKIKQYREALQRWDKAALDQLENL